MGSLATAEGAERGLVSADSMRGPSSGPGKRRVVVRSDRPLEAGDKFLLDETLG